MPELLPFCYGLLNNHRGLLKPIYDGVVFLTLGIEDAVVFLLQSLHQFLLIVTFIGIAESLFTHHVTLLIDDDDGAIPYDNRIA
ncbi:hypothetical protein [Duncaniella muris]|uniref:hypothetical protein n=1 Tax=Duncaniella muris TaxID=2094150 RepID=UPI00272BDEE7|nr:hypothetical protein [Duncaniella muris]